MGHPLVEDEAGEPRWFRVKGRLVNARKVLYVSPEDYGGRPSIRVWFVNGHSLELQVALGQARDQALDEIWGVVS